MEWLVLKYNFIFFYSYDNAIKLNPDIIYYLTKKA